MRRCSRCKETKELDLYFYRSSKPADHGHQRWCIACCRAYKRLPEVREKLRAYDRARGPWRGRQPGPVQPPLPPHRPRGAGGRFISREEAADIARARAA
jgi:hypothetical protein